MRLAHFSVDVVLLRDTGTLDRVRWFGRAAVFGWLGGRRHWGVGRCVHIDITRSTRVWFPPLLRGLSNGVIGIVNYWEGTGCGLRRRPAACASLRTCGIFGILEHFVTVVLWNLLTERSDMAASEYWVTGMVSGQDLRKLCGHLCL